MPPGKTWFLLPGPLRSKMLAGVRKVLGHPAWRTRVLGSSPSVCPPSLPPTPVDMGWNDGDHHLPEDPLEKWSLGHLRLAVGLERTGGAARGEEEESLALFERKEGQVAR